MTQLPYYRSRRDGNDDDDDEDDRKPPARNSYPNQRCDERPSNGRSNRNNHINEEEEDDHEEYHSESGAVSHTSSTAVASVDHSSFRDVTSFATNMVRRRHRNNHHSPYWWNQVLSPFRSSSSSSKSATRSPTAYRLYDPSKLTQRQSHYTDEDYIFHTPTNASMINAIRNEIHDSPMPSLTVATPYTPENNRFVAEEPQPTSKATIATSRPSTTSSSKAPTTSKRNDTTNCTENEGIVLTTNTSNGTPTIPVEQITNTTISTLQRNTIIYLGSTTMAWLILFSHILPPVVSYTLLWIIISTLLMIQAFYTTIQEYYYHMVVMGPGLGAMFLPQSVYNLLTQESLHEFLTDEVMVLEYRHLLLYFLPISSVQLRDLLRRIAPQHQQRLQRRGEIGTLLFGESIMRILLGHTQYEQWRSRRSLSPSASSVLSDDGQGRVRSSIPRQFSSQRRSTTLLLNDSFDDEQSDLGLDISGDDMIGGNDALAARLGLTATVQSSQVQNDRSDVRPLPNEVVMTTTTSTLSNRENVASNTIDGSNAAAVRATTYDDQEYQVLMDALWDSFYGTIWNPITDYVTTTYLVPTLHRVSRVTFHTGIVLLSVSGGNLFGIWGWSYQMMYNSLRMYFPARGLLSSTSTQQSRDTTTVNSDPPSQRVEPSLSLQSLGLFSRPSTTTWSTALVGSASLGISYFSSRYVRQYYMIASLDANNNNRSGTAANPTANDPRKSSKSFQSPDSSKKV